jgi:hypothetical protein
MSNPGGCSCADHPNALCGGLMSRLLRSTIVPDTYRAGQMVVRAISGDTERLSSVPNLYTLQLDT